MYNCAEFAVSLSVNQLTMMSSSLVQETTFPCESYTIVGYYEWRKNRIADVWKSLSETHITDVIYVLCVANITIFHRLMYRGITVHFNIGISCRNDDIIVALRHYILSFISVFRSNGN
jgi:hypothetical protein